MAEEQRCQEGHRLCANNCGFFGSPAMHDLCSKCYRDLRLKEEHASSAKIAVEKSLLSSDSSSAAASASSSSPSPSQPAAVASVPAAVTSPVKIRSPVAPVAAAPVAAGANRCAGCKRKVGLTGFKCRCGSTFCGAHRYPELHACSYDFKAAGKEAIARANPLVKAPKLHKI